MRRMTGAGKVSLDARVQGRGMLKASLLNFDIDGDGPKAEHLLFLRTRVAPLLEANRGRIWMQGSASRSGSDRHNLALSRRRVEMVAQVLRARGISTRQMQLDAVGERMAVGHGMEDERDRAVALVVLPFTDDRPPARMVPLPPPVSDEFKIRMLGGLTGSLGPWQTENLFFQIWDPRNHLTAFYTYSGTGSGRGVIPRIPVSVTLRGPWNSFKTSAPIRVSQFAGATRFTTAGAGPWTSNHLNMMGLPKSVATVPRVLSIATGFTVGAGASTSVGDLIWVPPEEMPFNGP